MFNFKVIPCLSPLSAKTIPLAKLRKWGCEEYHNMMKIGENIVDFDNAVAMIQNFLSQVAKKPMSKDIIEYLSMVEGYHYFFIK